jgi:hypothetical protein
MNMRSMRKRHNRFRGLFPNHLIGGRLPGRKPEELNVPAAIAVGIVLFLAMLFLVFLL